LWLFFERGVEEFNGLGGEAKDEAKAKAKAKDEAEVEVEAKDDTLQ